MDREYIYRWTEGDSGPYEVRGDAQSIYRAAIMIKSDRRQVDGEVLNLNYTPINKNDFFQDISEILGINNILPITQAIRKLK